MSIVEPDGRFDWHRDYGADFTWPSTHFSECNFLRDNGSDARFPWELNRCYWIAWLGVAATVEPERGFERDFVRLVDEWAAANPLDTGVNWSMPMEVAIRAFWLTFGSALFGDSATIDADWWARYHALIWSHGVYLESNLEYWPILTNHYLSNCMGMIAIGSHFRSSRKGRRWLEEGRRRLILELERQILPDGVDYERSIPYHGHVLEMVLISALLLDREGVPLPTSSIDTIERMIEFARAYMPPFPGPAPRMGDADDGQILRIDPASSPYDHRPLIDLGTVLVDRSEQNESRNSLGSPSNLLQLFLGVGRRGTESPDSGTTDTTSTAAHGHADSGRTAVVSSRLFQDGGYAVLTSNQIWCCIDCGPIGLHGNNDPLSFVLCDGVGNEWIVDRGTPCYNRSPALRNAFRSSRSHNGPVVNDAEVAEFEGLWRIKKEIDVAVDEFSTETDKDGRTRASLLGAGHSAFRNERGPVTLHRRWRLDDGTLQVTDTCRGKGSYRISTLFYLGPAVTIERIADRELLLSRRDPVRGEQSMRFTSSEPVVVSESDYAPSYGLIVPTTSLKVATAVSDTTEIRYLCEFLSRNPS
jgi:uncharacterized heparinase superfamily protein